MQTQSQKLILITGASGNIGSRIAELLSQQGHKLRLMARNTSKVKQLQGAEVVQGDYNDPESLDKAFTGVDNAFVVSIHGKPGDRAKLHKNAFDAAARAKVKHIVYLSFQGASPTSKFPMSRDHYQSEQYLKETGIPFTALRDNFYLDMLPVTFNSEGVLKGPAGDGKAAWVSCEDVAQVAAKILSNPSGHTGILDVTGQEALTLQETVERISKLVGRRLQYLDETVEEGKKWRSQLGVPDYEVDTWIGSYEAMAVGEMENASDTVSRILGRPAATIESYFNVHSGLLDGLRKLKE